ncbi:MAG: TonB-dependent receptor [Rubrivivax sp.]
MNPIQDLFRGRATAVGAAAALMLGAPVQAQGDGATQVIVVSATRHAMALVDAPASMSVVTREQIEARGADNLLEALRGDTGISMQARPIGGRKAINLRGMDSRHTLVLVDGKRIGASDGVIGHSDFQYDWIAVDDIERVEVIRGPMSVLYGAEALGGVVNVITRAPGAERWRFGVMAEGSSAAGERGGDGFRASLHADGPLGGGLRLGISASDVRRESVENLADARTSDLEGRRKRDASVRLHWTPAAGHELAAELRDGTELRWADARERSGARRYYRSETPLDRGHASLGWTWQGGGALDLRTQLRAYRSTLSATSARTNGVAPLRPNELDDRVLEGQLSLAAAAGQLSTTGFEARREELLNNGLPGGGSTADHRSLYLQHEAELARGLSLTAGLRYDHHSRFGHEWSPRAYLVWHPAAQWTVKGGYGHGFKAPTLKQISPTYKEDEGPFTYVGNAAVVPETNDSVELGVGWDSGRTGVLLTLFRNQVDDLIVTRPIGVVAGRTTYVFENSDHATLQGLEAAFSLKPAKGLTLAASWQFLDATDATGARLEKRPRHQAGLSVDWSDGRWRAGARVEHQRGLLLSTGVVGQPLQAMPDITLVSAQAGLALNANLDLGFGVGNLGNVDLASKSPLFAYAEAPRTWRLTLRGRW